MSSHDVPYFLQLSHLSEYAPGSGLEDLFLAGSGSLLVCFFDITDVGAAERSAGSGSLLVRLVDIPDVGAADIQEVEAAVIVC